MITDIKIILTDDIKLSIHLLCVKGISGLCDLASEKIYKFKNIG
jgi:hypothetical protein